MMKYVFLLVAFAAFVAAQTFDPSVYPVNNCIEDVNVDVPSPVFTGGSLNGAGITLNFQLSNWFAGVKIEFTTGSQPAYCGYLSGEVGLAANNFWHFTSSETCGDIGTVYANYAGAEVGNALGKCFVYDNTTDANWVNYNSLVKVTTRVQRPSIRGDAIYRTVVTNYRLAFRFQRYIDITSFPRLNVTGFANATADIVENIFNPVTRVYKLKLVTTVQKPYILSTADASYTLTGPGFVSDINGVASASGAPYFVEGQCTDQDAVCVQYWTATFRAPDDVCVWAPLFAFHFKVTCNSEYLVFGGEDNCDPIARDFDVPFQMQINNFCVQVVQDIGLTGTLRVYGNAVPSGANPGATLNNFLYGQTAYFRADITASNGLNVLIDNVEFISATVTSFSKTLNLVPVTALDNDFSFAYYNNLYISATTDAGAAGFSISISAASIGISDVENQAQPVQISATFRVAYLNANNDVVNSVGTKSLMSEEVVVKQHFRPMDNNIEFSASTLTTSIFVVRPTSAVTSTSSLIPAVAASAAGVALLSMFVAFVLYRRRTSVITKAQRTPPESKEQSASTSA